eukprot:5814410-Pyramimonas_sp.AAC.1
MLKRQTVQVDHGRRRASYPAVLSKGKVGILKEVKGVKFLVEFQVTFTVGDETKDKTAIVQLDKAVIIPKGKEPAPEQKVATPKGHEYAAKFDGTEVKLALWPPIPPQNEKDTSMDLYYLKGKVALTQFLMDNEFGRPSYTGKDFTVLIRDGNYEVWTAK